ncbi:MAG: hypothetical protein GKC10_09275 [Methanosarcinales archaeon]|nr:hypothetical protein [Methanosarcinales archaeon]
MKGIVSLASIIITALLACSVAVANPPLEEPVQYEQYCEDQKVAGTGVIDISTSMVDKKIALEYFNVMSGEGDIELDSEHTLSENASKLLRNATDKEMPFNLFEESKLTFKGDTPLVGGKFLHSKSFYGGIGAQIQESFSVTEIEKEQKAFFASTDARGHWTDESKIEELSDVFNASPTHLVGLNTKNSFTGTWGTDSAWHKIFYKDIKDHQMFTGTFEAEKLIKFHEAPFSERPTPPCAGVDC